jgi:hypothetical protein
VRTSDIESDVNVVRHSCGVPYRTHSLFERFPAGALPPLSLVVVSWLSFLLCRG